MEQIKVMNYDAQSVIPSESWGYIVLGPKSLD